jgi:hypothetical protein
VLVQDSKFKMVAIATILKVIENSLPQAGADTQLSCPSLQAFLSELTVTKSFEVGA